MKKVILPTLLSLFLFSCSEEIENTTESYQTNKAMLSKSVPMIEDRLYFNSAEEFTNLHITLSENSKKFDEYKKQLFSEGFLSPESPIEENEELARDYLNNVYSFLEKNVNQSVQNGFDAAKLNDFFWKGAWTTTQSILSYMPDKFNVNSPNRTAAFKFPKESVIIVQKSQIKSSTNDNKIKTTFDYGGGINLSFSNMGGGSSWNISGGAMSGLIKPKNFKIKFIGAAKTSMGWRGSKISSI